MLARGIRNKNPGNLRLGTIKWKGLIDNPEESTFCTFESMGMGCRALLRTLRTYVEKYDLRSVRKIIERWAPSIENDTESYILSVCAAVKHGPDELINFHDQPWIYLDIARAIARHECGTDAYKITSDDWEVGMKGAGL